MCELDTPLDFYRNFQEEKFFNKYFNESKHKANKKWIFKPQKKKDIIFINKLFLENSFQINIKTLFSKCPLFFFLNFV